MKRLAFTAAVLLLPALASAQSLAELAAKEREKKKHQKAPAKVFTDDDLQKAGQSGRGTANTGGAAPAASPSPGETVAKADTPGAQKTAEQLRAEQEQAWREKLKKAEDEVTRLTQLQDTIQRNLNDITGNIYGSQRTLLLSELEKTRAQLQAAVAQVETLNEEGRRNRYR